MLVVTERTTTGDRKSWIKTPISLLRKCLRRLRDDTSGQDQVEYAVLVSGIALVAALSLPAVADRVGAVLGNTQTVLDDANDCRNPNPGTYQGKSPCAP